MPQRRTRPKTEAGDTCEDDEFGLEGRENFEIGEIHSVDTEKFHELDVLCVGAPLWEDSVVEEVVAVDAVDCVETSGVYLFAVDGCPTV